MIRLRAAICGLLLCWFFGVAQAQSPSQPITTYAPLNIKQQIELFDVDFDGAIDESHAAAPQLQPATMQLLGYVAAEDTCTQHQLLTAKSVVPPAPSNLANKNLLTGIVEGQSKAMRAVAAGSFLFVYQTAVHPDTLADMLLHPLTTMSCGMQALQQETVGKMQNGWQQRDPELLSEGATNLLVAVVTVGAGVESMQGVLPKNLWQMGQQVGMRLDGVVGFDGTLALQPVLVTTIPLRQAATRIASGGAAVAGTAGMGLVLNYADNRYGQADEMGAPSEDDYKIKKFTFRKVVNPAEELVNCLVYGDEGCVPTPGDFFYIGTATENATGKTYHVAGYVLQTLPDGEGGGQILVKITHRNPVGNGFKPLVPTSWTESTRFRSRFYMTVEVE